LTSVPPAKDQNGADQISEMRLRTLARERLHSEPPSEGSRGPSDFDLNPGSENEIPDDPVRKAAVLVPVVAGDDLSVILTMRTGHLSSHAGQIAFPGGKLDQGEGVLDTALREAEEEIGLLPAFVEPIGYLDWYRTRTGFVVSPVVALIRPGFKLQANPAEVDDVFEVPLSFLMDAANHAKHKRFWRGQDRSFYAMPYGERYIWGATAGMIKNLYEKLRAV
jgi:8-oxo-dGTP pyrophosphatase MutT (NUDIX family)